MPIYKRKGSDTWYIAISTASGRRIRRSACTEDKQAAQELHDKLKHELWRQERLDEKPKRTWDEACIRWIKEKGHKKTINEDIRKIATLKKLRGVFLHHLSRDFLTEVIAELPCGNSTKNRYWALIRAILNKAMYEWEWIDKVPKISTYPTPKRRIRWLQKHEVERLIEHLPPYMVEMVIFSLATGLRQSNVLNLKWNQLDLMRKVAWFHGDEMKNGRAFGISLNQTAINAIERQKGKHPVFVFTNSQQNPVKSISARIWKNALIAAQIEDFRWHDLRHTWASWLVQSGTPLSVLQEMGGWESVSMVQRYAHLAPEHLHRYSERIDKQFAMDTEAIETGFWHKSDTARQIEYLSNLISRQKNQPN